MLNGPVADAIANPNSSFGSRLASATESMAKVDAIYLGLLSRYPTTAERQVLAPVVADRGDNAKLDIIHALLNTGEFLFVK